MTTTLHPPAELDDGLTTDQRRLRDESALRDALAYLETCPEDERVETERSITTIRGRLRDRGAHAEASKPKWVRGRNVVGDPVGTVRLRRVDAEDADEHPFPRGPRNGGAIAAVLPLALVVISGAWRVMG